MKISIDITHLKKAQEGRKAIMKKSEGQNFKQLKLSHKNKINSLLGENKIKIDNDIIGVDHC